MSIIEETLRNLEDGNEKEGAQTIADLIGSVGKLQKPEKQ